MNLFVCPPTTSSEAIILPSAKQWDARRGAYCVCTQIGVENPITSVDNISSFYSVGSFWNSPSQTTLYGFGSLLSSVTQGAANTLPQKYYAPFNTSGVWLTGLSQSTTLQVNFKLILESVPNPRDVYATMSKPATPYSVEALRLYGELIENLPAGVPFDENPSGEWFSQVLGMLGELASTAGMINPMFGLVGKGFGMGKKIFDQISHSMDKKIKDHKPSKTIIVERPMPHSDPHKKKNLQIQKLKSELQRVQGGAKSSNVKKKR